MGKPVPAACRERAIRRHADDRLHPRQSAPLGIGRKRGEQKQAVGRSRGGRNTKIHALADAKGRLIAIDWRRSTRLSARAASHRVKPSKHLLGDKAFATRYDRLARDYLASLCPVTPLIWWI